MPIYWRESLKGAWAVIVYTDPYTVHEWDHAIAEIMAHRLGQPPMRLLVDRRHCTAPPEEFVRHIGLFLQQHGSYFDGGHVAVVASDEAGYGVARMTEILVAARQLPCAVRAFLDWEEAEGWLAQNHEGSVTGFPHKGSFT